MKWSKARVAATALFVPLWVVLGLAALERHGTKGLVFVAGAFLVTTFLDELARSGVELAERIAAWRLRRQVHRGRR